MDKKVKCLNICIAIISCLSGIIQFLFLDILTIFLIHQIRINWPNILNILIHLDKN